MDLRGISGCSHRAPELCSKTDSPPPTDGYRTDLERRAEFSGCPREITRGTVDFQTREEVYSTDVAVIFFAGTFVTFKQFYPPPRSEQFRVRSSFVAHFSSENSSGSEFLCAKLNFTV